MLSPIYSCVPFLIFQTRGEESTGEQRSHQLYLGRWWILICVFLLRFAKSGHLFSFAAVSNKCATYYNQTGDRIDLILSVSYMVGAAFWILNAYTIDAWGIKRTLWCSGLMIFLGSIIITNNHLFQLVYYL